MARRRVERRLAAILSADTVGDSRILGQDEADTLDRLSAHRAELIDPTIGEYKGRIVKLMSDGVLVEFASVVEAVECAIAIQHGMTRRNVETPEDRRIELRIGVNLGDIIIDGDDIYGDVVNVAARLESFAAAGLGERGEAKVPFTVARSCPFCAGAPVIRCIYYVYVES